MKNSSTKIKELGKEGKATKSSLNSNITSRSKKKQPMTEHTIAPPAHIWDKIEQVLDQQEKRKTEGTSIIKSTFQANELAKKKLFYLSAISCIGMTLAMLTGR